MSIESKNLFEQKAYQQFKAGEFLAAKENYERALAAEANAPRLHFALAQTLQGLEDYAAALSHLKICAEAMPNQPKLLFQLGACYLHQNEIQNAKENFEQVLLHEPHHVEALVNLGICFLREKDYLQAIHFLSTASRLDEAHLPALFNLASCLMEAKRFYQAKDYFQRYVKLAPDDAEAIEHLGFVCMQLDQLDESKKHFQSLLDRDRNHRLAMHNLASIAVKQREPSVALGYYQRILLLDSADEIAIYMHAALAHQLAPAKAPATYVKALFDQYAPGFEAHLKEVLNYETPKHLYELWQKARSDEFSDNELDILDLGCGTGLMGEYVKSHAAELVGVDLSPEMLEIARNKNLYTALYESELEDFLNSHEEVFDLAVLADVLVYFGDLAPLFEVLSAKAKAVLFSVESGAGAYQLEPSGRYTHGLDYVLKILEDSSFSLIAKKEVVLRKQEAKSVKGWVCYAKNKGEL